MASIAMNLIYSGQQFVGTSKIADERWINVESTWDERKRGKIGEWSPNRHAQAKVTLAKSLPKL